MNKKNISLYLILSFANTSLFSMSKVKTISKISIPLVVGYSFGFYTDKEALEENKLFFSLWTVHNYKKTSEELKNFFNIEHKKFDALEDKERIEKLTSNLLEIKAHFKRISDDLAKEKMNLVYNKYYQDGKQ